MLDTHSRWPSKIHSQMFHSNFSDPLFRVSGEKIRISIPVGFSNSIQVHHNRAIYGLSIRLTSFLVLLCCWWDLHFENHTDLVYYFCPTP